MIILRVGQAELGPRDSNISRAGGFAPTCAPHPPVYAAQLAGAGPGALGCPVVLRAGPRAGDSGGRQWMSNGRTPLPRPFPSPVPPPAEAPPPHSIADPAPAPFPAPPTPPAPIRTPALPARAQVRGSAELESVPAPSVRPEVRVQVMALSQRCLLYLKVQLFIFNLIFWPPIQGLHTPPISQFDRYAQDDLKSGLRRYGTPGDPALTQAWDTVQTEFRCCGVQNFTDWFEIQNATALPESCCLEHGTPCHSPTATWWKEPCYEKVKRWVGENIWAMGIFAACIGVVQVLGLISSMLMYCQVLQAEKHYE
ncbi:tetraspanin-4 isoform X7 [Alligator mississippiensis]|uniref:tetraspanin-4 isoform X7 n=1 Tax=Alligator mississippiensis TaxID=8496 RepID=UPI00287768A9|nr:tetraspanin-4 isoform X7 [Alligator mississippiensis]